HAYYFGAEARKAQMEALKTNNQLVAPQYLAQAAWQPNQPIPHPPWGPPTLPNATAGSLQPPTPAQAAMDPRNPGPPALAQAMQTNPGLPGQLAAGNLTTAFDNYIDRTKTAPPAFGPPVPGASSNTPNNTTSNGDVPVDVPRVAPDSVMRPDGGTKNAAPAASNGSPPPLAINPQQIAAI